MAESLIWILPSHLVRSPLSERERIFINFLLQSKKEEDAEVKETIKKEIFGMLKSLLERLGQQESDTAALPEAVEVHSKSTGLDWLLLNTIKWTMAYD